jgi:hypothetical protein
MVFGAMPQIGKASEYLGRADLHQNITPRRLGGLYPLIACQHVCHCVINDRNIHLFDHLPAAVHSFTYIKTNHCLTGCINGLEQFLLFLLFKMDFAEETKYRQQIKTFRLKYVFLAGKIIRTTRRVVMKLSEKYPYQEVYEKSLS